jgi:polyisoprenoid-binding protein YceI
MRTHVDVEIRSLEFDRGESEADRNVQSSDVFGARAVNASGREDLSLALAAPPDMDSLETAYTLSSATRRHSSISKSC